MSLTRISAIIACCALITACSSQRSALVDYTDDPAVVAVVDGTPFTLGEFEASYAKSVGGRDEARRDSLGEYADFLERYIDFRLKVRVGEAAGLDTASSIVEEIDSYREQFARPYLIDRRVIDPIIRDIYEKQGVAIDASHILIRVAPDAPPSDTLDAYGRLAAIRDSVLAGSDFGDMAIRHSEDPSASNAQQGPGYRGHLGYFTGGRMVQAFEDQAFSTAPGEVSDVFRTRFGYHILLVHDRRDMPQDIQLAHIMLAASGQTPEDSLAAFEFGAALVDSVAAGVAFADLAERHSTDARSATRGGDLGWISFDSRLIEPLKAPAFSMDVGAVSEPVWSPFGLHVLMVTDTRTRPTFEDSYEDLKTRSSRLPRVQGAERQYMEQLLADAPHSVDTTAFRRAFDGFSSDSLLQALRTSSIDSVAAMDTVVSLRSTDYTLQNVSDWASGETLQPGPYPLATMMTVAEEFLLDKVLELEIDHLEETDSDFRNTMKEFRDGLILFRVMEDSVWSLAATDSVALEALYDSEPSAYVYPDRARILGFQCQGRAVADSVVALLDRGLSPDAVLTAVLDSSGTVVRLDTTLVAGPTNSVFDRALGLEDGQWTEPVSYNRGFIVMLRSGSEPSRRKTLEEARAELVTEHQAALENALVSRLRQMYSVTTYPGKLSGAFAQPATEQAESSSASEQ